MRLPACSFPRIEATWNFTVCSEIPSFQAIVLLAAPSAIMRSTSSSRAVSVCAPADAGAGAADASSVSSSRGSTTAMPRGGGFHGGQNFLRGGIAREQGAHAQTDGLLRPRGAPFAGEQHRRRGVPVSGGSPAGQSSNGTAASTTSGRSASTAPRSGIGARQFDAGMEAASASSPARTTADVRRDRQRESRRLRPAQRQPHENFAQARDVAAEERQPQRVAPGIEHLR